MLVLLFIFPVYGSTVTIAPRASLSNPGVTFKTQFGYLNSTNTQVFNSLTVFANGTIFFDVNAPTATNQGTYIFQTKSYGNGTMDLRFAGPLPSSVSQSATTSNYVSGKQEITYTSIQTSQLVLVYKPTISFGIVTFSSLFSILMAAVGSVFIFSLISLGVQATRPEEKVPPSWLPSQTVSMIVAVVAVVGFVLLLIIGASLVPVCPQGYTCTG